MLPEDREKDLVGVASGRLSSESTVTGRQVRERLPGRYRGSLGRYFGRGGLRFNRPSDRCAERLLVGDQIQRSPTTERVTRRPRWGVTRGGIRRAPTRQHDSRDEKGDVWGAILRVAGSIYSKATKKTSPRD